MQVTQTKGTPWRNTLSGIGWVGSWFFYGIVLVGPFIGTCTQGGTDNWRASLIFFLPIAWFMLCLALLGLSKARFFRWFALPHIVTVLAGLYVVLPYFWGATVQGAQLCLVRDGASAILQAGTLGRVWAPVQLTGLILLAFFIFLFWWAGRGAATQQVVQADTRKSPRAA